MFAFAIRRCVDDAWSPACVSLAPHPWMNAGAPSPLLHLTLLGEQLREWFVDALAADAVQSVRIIRDRATNVGKGFAYVAFKEREHVFQALAISGKQFSGRDLRISQCQVRAAGIPRVHALAVRCPSRTRCVSFRSPVGHCVLWWWF